MPVITMGKTPVAARLLRYTVKEKANSTKERVLHSAGLHCRVETSAQEFAAHRRRHGKQGAVRKSPARYELPEEGEVATHVRRTRPGGRRYWAVATSEQEATHVRREGALIKENEAVHYIVSCGLDDVNPEDPQQVALAFEGIVTMFRDLYPGIQMHLVGQADGKGMTPDLGSDEKRGKFHVHGVGNAVVFERMEVDGRVWEAGSKVSGSLTDIDRVRERQDAWLAEHGAKWGLTQRLAPVREQSKDKRSIMDRRMASKGEVSNHDAIRDALWAALDDPRCVGLDAFKGVMAQRGVEVVEPGWRRGKAPKVRRLSYRVEGMATNVTGETLGELYTYDHVLSQLEANATGAPRQPRPQQQGAGAPKPATTPTDEQLTHAREAVARMVREERLDSWLDDWTREENTSVETLLSQRYMTRDHPADRDVLHGWMSEWETERAKKQAQATTTTPPKMAPTPPSTPVAQSSATHDDSTPSVGKTLEELLAESETRISEQQEEADQESERLGLRPKQPRQKARSKVTEAEDGKASAPQTPRQPGGSPPTEDAPTGAAHAEALEQPPASASVEAVEDMEAATEAEERADDVTRPTGVRTNTEETAHRKRAAKRPEVTQQTDKQSKQEKAKAVVEARMRKYPELRDAKVRKGPVLTKGDDRTKDDDQREL